MKGSLGYSIKPFSIDTTSEKHINLWYKLRVNYQDEILPEEPFPTKEEIVSQKILINENQKFSEWTLWNSDNSKIIGNCRINSYKSNLTSTIAGFSIVIQDSYRKQGLGTACLKLILDSAIKSGYDLLRTHSNELCREGGLFLLTIGFKNTGTSHTNQLFLKDLNRNLVKEWLDLPSNPSINIKIYKCFGRFPEKLIPEIRNFFQTVYDAEPIKNGVKREKIEFTTENIRKNEELFSKGSKRRIVLFATEAITDKLIGMTTILWAPARPAKVSQYYTAVIPEFRKIGIAKRLKAEMLTIVFNQLPEAEKIWTGNDDSNEAMLRINNKLGFKPYIKSTSWEIETDILKKYLSQKHKTT